MDDSGFDSDPKQRQSQEDDRLFPVSATLQIICFDKM